MPTSGRPASLIAAGLVAAAALVSPAAADAGPGRVRFAPEPPADASSDQALAGKAAQWVNAPTSVPARASQRPINFGGLLIAYQDGEAAETCVGQFISPNIILTAASCVSDRRGEHLTGPFELYQGYDRRDYDTRYVGSCMAYYEGWKGEAGGDYSYDYAMIYSPKRSETGFYRVQLPPGLRPLRLYDIQKRRPVVIDGRISNGISLVNRFKPDDPADAPELRGGAWIYKFSKRDDPQKNFVSSLTSHVDRKGVIHGPGVDRAFEALRGIVQDICSGRERRG